MNNTGGGEAIQLNNYNDRAFVDDCWTVYPPSCVYHIHLFLPEFVNQDVKTVAHEAGHYFGKIHDEYHEVNGDFPSHCGHSMMGNFRESPMNYNLCYCNSWNFSYGGFCDTNMGDHNTDGNVAPDPITLPSWNVLVSAPYVDRPTRTPDNYSYESFDFNGLVARIQ